MKTRLVILMLENLSVVRRFVPEKDLLATKLAADALDTLKKNMAALSQLSDEEKLASGVAAIDLIHDHPATRELLEKVAEATIDYYDHVTELEGSASAPTSNLAN